MDERALRGAVGGRAHGHINGDHRLIERTDRRTDGQVDERWAEERRRKDTRMDRTSIEKKINEYIKEIACCVDEWQEKKKKYACNLCLCAF